MKAAGHVSKESNWPTVSFNFLPSFSLSQFSLPSSSHGDPGQVFSVCWSGRPRVPEARMERMNVTEIYEGIEFPGHLHSQDSMQAATEFQFQDTDVLIATYPKSGTTWMQEILTLIFSKGSLELAHTIPSWARAPWLEHIFFNELMAKMNPTFPRIFSTHLPSHILAPALKKSKVTVLYVARHPKDVLVSFYHFHKIAKFLPDLGNFDDFLDQFLKGKVHFGSWFTHVQGWMDLREEVNINLITYEDLSREPRRTIQRLCDILGCQLQSQEEDMILKNCTFSAMSQNSMANYSLVSNKILDQTKGKFLRKGKIGDWREHFSPEQNKKFNTIYLTKMKDYILHFPWSLD
uniref:Sulfotransferase n=1 Tax=Ornithorhynchus anatinus TaxID=9258 RepID=A0A6I8PH68_ORNAN